VKVVNANKLNYTKKSKIKTDKIKLKNKMSDYLLQKLYGFCGTKEYCFQMLQNLTL